MYDIHNNRENSLERTFKHALELTRLYEDAVNELKKDSMYLPNSIKNSLESLLKKPSYLGNLKRGLGVLGKRYNNYGLNMKYNNLNISYGLYLKHNATYSSSNLLPPLVTYSRPSRNYTMPSSLANY